MARRPRDLTRELLTLVALVVAIDAAFLAVYVAAGLASTTGNLKLGFTALWTAATLAVALRSLARIRAARLRARHR